MTRALKLLIPVLILAVMAGWCDPVFGARLASVSGEAGATEITDDDEFELSEQTQVKISYNVTEIADGCAANVIVYRKQNDRWLVVSTVVRTAKTASGSSTLTLSKGSYRIQVKAKQARYDVSVDK